MSRWLKSVNSLLEQQDGQLETVVELKTTEAEVQAQRTELERAAERMEKDRTRQKEEKERLITRQAEELKVVKLQYEQNVSQRKARSDQQLEDARTRMRELEERRIQEGGDWAKKLDGALQREQEYVRRMAMLEDEKSTLLSQVFSLQAQQTALEHRLESISQTADKATEREREAKDRLDAAFSIHARQLTQRQIRETELERTIADLGAALVVARHKEINRLKTAENGDFSVGSGGSDFSALRSILENSEDSVESLTAQLDLERQRLQTLHQELQEISKERTEEASAAHARQLQNDRKIADMSVTISRLQASLRDAERAPFDDCEDSAYSVGDDENTVEIRTLSEQVLRQQETTEVLLESENAADPGTSLLLLFLRLNDMGARLDPSICWEYLTIREMYNFRLLSKSFNRKLARVEYNRCHDMRDYVVPHPGYPGVLSTPSDVQAEAALYAHQLAGLQAMHQAENRNSEFGSLRGGILGDAPGLGKTITMLAHIASTAGLRPTEPAEFYDEESLVEGWKSMRMNPVFTTDINKTLKPVWHWVTQNGSSEVRQTFRDLVRFVEPPYQDDRLLTLKDFERHVRRTLAPVVPLAEMELFRHNVRALKAGLDKRKRSYFLNEKGKRLVFERNLMPCSSTLIIVPDVLMEHWAEQIRRHLNLEVFTETNNGGGSRGVVYIDGVGDLADTDFSLNDVSLHGLMEPASHLMRYMIVVVTFSRCEQEYRKEVMAGRMQNIRNAHNKKRRREAALSPSYAVPSPLLQLRWFRLVVDEGHELGAHEAGSRVTRFINELAAERRWVLSGTPTTGDEDSEDFTSNGLDQLQRLLLFLRHPLYGTVPPPAEHQGSGNFSQPNQDQAKGEWIDRVKVPFLRKKENGRTELFRVLGEIMVMHHKEDVHLPKPIFKQGEVNVLIPDAVVSMLVDAVHTNTNQVREYMNILDTIGVDIRRRGRNLCEKLKNSLDRNDKEGIYNILLDEYLSTDGYQSLVDEAQGRYIIDSVQRERRFLPAEGSGPLDFCNGADQRAVKAVVYSRSNHNLQSVAEHLYRGFVHENIAELFAGRIGDMSSELSRFRKGYKQGRECPICCRWNDVGGSVCCSNRLMEVTDVENRRFLVEPERVIRALDSGELQEIAGNVERTRLGGEPLTKYSMNSKHWKVGDVLEIDVRDPHPILPPRWNGEKWAKHGSEKCIQLAENDNWEGRDWFFGPLPIYEDNRDHVVVRLAKWQPCSRFHDPYRWYKGPQLSHAQVETVEEDVFLLCLDAQLSSGLDLSFVTHMFLLEPIDDAALLEQVTSRAYRLGATGPVVIETVNVWDEMSSRMKEDPRVASLMSQEREKPSGTAVCDHCFRSFDSLEKAENHETKCDRNPDSTAVVDPYHLSSVYRDIHPPRPLTADSGKDDAPVHAARLGSQVIVK